MLKHSLLLTLAVFMLSCGQNRQSAVVENSSDSTSQSSNTAVQTPGEATDTNGVPMKHEAYNQEITTLPLSLAQFVPEGYTALDTTQGDLNLDQYPDMILVLRKNGEDSTSDVTEHPEKRPLLILTGQADHSYKLAARNDNSVLCIDCGGVMGDPFMDVVVKNGYFSIEHYGGSSWRWTRTVTFKYAAADNYWYLHKDGGDSFHASDPDKVTTKVRTTKDFGKVPFDKFDIYQSEE